MQIRVSPKFLVYSLICQHFLLVRFCVFISFLSGDSGLAKVPGDLGLGVPVDE